MRTCVMALLFLSLAALCQAQEVRPVPPLQVEPEARPPVPTMRVFPIPPGVTELHVRGLIVVPLDREAIEASLRGTRIVPLDRDSMLAPWPMLPPSLPVPPRRPQLPPPQ